MITSEQSEPSIAEDVQLMLQLEQGQLDAALARLVESGKPMSAEKALFVTMDAIASVLHGVRRVCTSQ